MSKWFQKLTPELAWQQYVDEPIELFISIYLNDGITDIDKMCNEFAKGIPYLTGKLFTQKQLEHIALLIKQHIEKEGYDKDNLYTEEELDTMYEQDVKYILDATKNYKW